MSDDIRDLRDLPATPDEEAAARRLAEALEGQADAGPDNDVPAADLAAARLLQALGAEERPDRRDEVAERRLRRELVRAASRPRRFRQAARSLAAASILLAAAAVTAHLATRHRVPHDLAELGTREAEARAAVARLITGGDAAKERLGEVTDTLREARLSESLWLSRFDRVLLTSGSGAKPSPTPGGPES